MSLVQIEMPSIAECSVAECAYNVDNNCRARAITIGDGVHPGCDTFVQHQHVKNAGQAAGLGACKVTTCRYNQDCECMGDRVRIGLVAGTAACLSYNA